METQFHKFQKGGVAALRKVKKAVFSLQTVIGGLAIGMVARDVIKTKNEFVKYQKTLETLEGSQKAANKKWQEMLQFAEETPFKINQVMESYKTLKAFGLDPTVETMRIMGDTAAALGGSDVLGRIALVLGQIRAQGFMTAQDMNQLANAGINAGKVMKDTFGAARDEVAKLKDQGVTANMIIEALMKNMEKKFGGQMFAMNRELSGQWEMLISIWERFEVSIMDSGLYEYINKRLTFLNKQIIKLRADGTLKKWAEEISDSLTKSMDVVSRKGIPLIATVGKTLFQLIDKLNEHPEIVKYGLIGYFFWGKKGLALGAIIGANIDKLKKGWEESGPLGVMWEAADVMTKLEKSLLGIGHASNKADPTDFANKWIVAIEKIKKEWEKEQAMPPVPPPKKKVGVGDKQGRVGSIIENTNKTIDAYNKLIDQLEFEKSLLGENEVTQRAMTLARQNDIKIGSTQYNRILKLVKAYDAEVNKQKTRNKIIEEGKSLTESLLTPQEQYAKTIKRLNTLLGAGAITQETYNRAVEKAKEDFTGLEDKGKTAMETLTDAVNGFGQDSAQAITDFALHGKMTFSDMIDSMISDLVRMMIYEQITAPFFRSISGFFAPAPVSPTPVSPAITMAAKGNVFQSGKVIPFARGGVVAKPTVFPMASGVGLMGEAGPEAVFPLKRGPGGNLGIEASGGGAIVNIYNNVGADVSTSERKTAGGTEIDVMIDNAVAKKLGQFGSQSNKAMRHNFGARQQLTGR